MFKIALSKSKELIKGKWLTLWGVILVYFGVLFGVSCTSNPVLINCGCFLIGLPLAFGFMKYLINVYHKKEKLEDLIYYFENYAKSFKLILATTWYTLIFSIGFCLLVVPGIIWAYRYILVFYILITDERVSIKKAFEMSKEKMHGHKFKYFAASIVLVIAPIIISMIGFGFISVGSFNGVKENPQLLDTIKEEIIAGLSESEIADDIYMDDIEELFNLEVKEDVYEEIVEEDAEANVIELNHKTALGNVGAIILGFVLLIGGWIWLLILYPRLLMVETTYACELLAKDKKEE